MTTFSPWFRFWVSALTAGVIAGTGAVTIALTGEGATNAVQWAFVGATTLGAIAKDMQAKLASPPAAPTSTAAKEPV